MTGVEIVLIIVGVVFLLVSFLIQEKLSPKDMEEITKLSEKELKIIVERQLKNSGDKIESVIERVLEEEQEEVKRATEKETNEKIMAIDEFSNTIMDSMNKTHNEILFLYNMLNDKHAELTDMTAKINQFSEQIRNTESEVLANLSRAVKEVEKEAALPQQKKEPVISPQAEAAVEVPQEPDVPQEKKEDTNNHNGRILAMHQQGMSDVEIARALGLGLGEVRLVIGLFRGEETSEV